MTDTMSLDEFGQNEPAILADVCAILNGKTKTRRKLRIVAVYERGTGRLVAEVLHTSQGPVVVHRVAAIETDAGRPRRVDVRGFRREHAVATFTGDPDQQFAIKGDAAVYVVTGRNFIARG